MIMTEELEVFKRAHKLALEIYSVTKDFPREEMFGLAAQMRRAAISIDSNLAEGGARRTSGEYVNFIGNARGSAAELKYQVSFSCDLGYLNTKTANEITEELRQIIFMLSSLMKSIKN